MFYDTDGNEIADWRVTGLVAGHDSAVLVVGVDTPQDTDLTIHVDERITVLARLNGTSDPFVDIAASPIDLRTLSGRIFFDLKLRASMDADGFDRVALNPGTVTESGAEWTG